MVFQDDLEASGTLVRSYLPASKRIRVFLNQLTEAEIMDLWPLELAARCGCSVRHFNRLFSGNFGLSLRAKQTELRLLKARQLLAKTRATVNAVAAACGYPHAGLLNALFRRRFGLKPTEWRTQTLAGAAAAPDRAPRGS